MSAAVGDDQVDVNLTPLLDLVLQLIMFFIITVNFVAGGCSFCRMLRPSIPISRGCFGIAIFSC